MRVEFVCDSKNETSEDKQKHFAVLLFACILPNLFGYLFGVRHILTHFDYQKEKCGFFGQYRLLFTIVQVPKVDGFYGTEKAHSPKHKHIT